MPPDTESLQATESLPALGRPRWSPRYHEAQKAVLIRPYPNSWLTESWVEHASWTEIMQGIVGAARITESDSPGFVIQLSLSFM